MFAITAVLVLLVAGVTGAVILTRDDAAEAEVFLQAEDQPGADPFTAPVTKDKPPAPATVPSTVKAASSGGGGSSGGISSLPAAGPGLYGGTENISYCDPERMIVFLEQNPDKASAWAGVLGIQRSEIRTYVGTLTSVLLRTDTRVTNHGFANGRATVVPAVLQSGTAVLVDKYGVPRVKCNCGNPLTPPTALKAPRYTGRPWNGYNVTNIVVIQQSTTIINTYILTNVNSGGTFERPAGSNGSQDRPVGSGSTTTSPPDTDPPTPPSTDEPDQTTTTRPPVSTPPTTPTPTRPPTTPLPTTPPTTPSSKWNEQTVRAEFLRRRQICLNLPDIKTRWPFKESTTPDQYTVRREGPETWLFTAVNHPPGETQTWTWSFLEPTEEFVATNSLAATANQGCPTLETG